MQYLLRYMRQLSEADPVCIRALGRAKVFADSIATLDAGGRSRGGKGHLQQYEGLYPLHDLLQHW